MSYVPSRKFVLYTEKKFVLYDHPKGYPNDVIVRGQMLRSDGSIKYDSSVRVFNDIDTAKAWMKSVSLKFVSRSAEDAPEVVGSAT